MDLKNPFKKVGQALGSIVQGNFLVDERVKAQYPFILFLAVLAIVSIQSTDSADYKVHHINSLRKNLKDLSSDYIETRSRLMEASIESEVLERAAELGLKRPAEPPVRIQNTLANGE